MAIIRRATSFSTSDPTTLLLDNATYTGKQKNILSAENKLVLDTAPLELENEACGTECMCLITDYWKQTEDAGIKFREFTCNDVDFLLTRVMQSINKTSEDAADALKVDEASGNNRSTLVGDGDPFDDEGSYGGNQSGPDRGLNLFGWVIWKDDDLYDFIRQHPGYENYTDAQIHKLLENLENHGCSYVAAVNIIFNSFKGREDEFEKTFGFPMYDENGDLNYNKLLVDYYLETGNKVFFDSSYGLDAYTTLREEYYKVHKDEYEALYGEPLYDSDGNLSENLYLNCFEEAKAAYESGAEYAEVDGSVDTTVINRLEHYCRSHGLSMSMYNVTGEQMSNEDIQKAIDNGYTVVFSAAEFELQYKNGFKYNFGIDIGGHEMTITGIDDEGRYIVSTWGEKLYLDLEDNSDDMRLWGYYAIKIN